MISFYWFIGILILGFTDVHAAPVTTEDNLPAMSSPAGVVSCSWMAEEAFVNDKALQPGLVKSYKALGSTFMGRKPQVFTIPGCEVKICTGWIYCRSRYTSGLALDETRNVSCYTKNDTCPTANTCVRDKVVNVITMPDETPPPSAPQDSDVIRMNSVVQ